MLGAGLAGAGVAGALVRRGWTVTVLDRAALPAAGASALPAGILAPHVSAGDALASQISRIGVALTLDFARQHLVEDEDWSESGVLERRLDGKPALPTGGVPFSAPATAQQKAAAGLALTDVATWHAGSGWLKPAALVHALLGQPGVHFIANAAVASLRCEGGTWVATDAEGAVLATAPLAVVCGGWASAALLADPAQARAPWPLQAIRGQLSMAGCTAASDAAAPWPVNGKGTWLPRVQLPAGDSWIAGAGFERGVTGAPTAAEVAAAHAGNLARLHLLLPAAAVAAEQAQARGELRTWHGVRGTLPDRLPAVGPVDHARSPGLWTSCGMGSRGISLALLCGELLAARCCGEPLPLAPRLARALDAARVEKWRSAG